MISELPFKVPHCRPAFRFPTASDRRAPKLWIYYWLRSACDVSKHRIGWENCAVMNYHCPTTFVTLNPQSSLIVPLAINQLKVYTCPSMILCTNRKVGGNPPPDHPNSGPPNPWATFVRHDGTPRPPQSHASYPLPRLELMTPWAHGSLGPSGAPTHDLQNI